MNVIREQLLQDGAVRFPNAIPTELFPRLRAHCAEAVSGNEYGLIDGGKDAIAAPVYPSVPVFRELITRGSEILTELGFPDHRWLAGALIPKWLGEGVRSWHVDWWGWSDSPDSWREVPPQVGILFYMDDAMLDSGAFMAIPGSHRRAVRGMGDYWGSSESHPDQEIICAKAGDAMLFDARILHGVMPNHKIPCRLGLTLWFLLDYDRLTPATRATAMLSVPPDFQEQLGSLCPDYGEPQGDTVPRPAFAHVKMPQFPIAFERIQELQRGRLDREIIGGMAQPGDEWLQTSQTYSWYFAIGAAKAAGRILELGVRFGYSLKALAAGAEWAGVCPELLGVDGELDGVESNAIALLHLGPMMRLLWPWPQVTILKNNTQELDITNAAINLARKGPAFDIVHVDGDHSVEGIRNELAIARMWAKPDALILVDDVDVAYVRDAAMEFAQALGIGPMIIPTMHHMMLIDLSKRTNYRGRP